MCLSGSKERLVLFKMELDGPDYFRPPARPLATRYPKCKRDQDQSTQREHVDPPELWTSWLRTPVHPAYCDRCGQNDKCRDQVVDNAREGGDIRPESMKLRLGQHEWLL